MAPRRAPTGPSAWGEPAPRRGSAAETARLRRRAVVLISVTFVVYFAEAIAGLTIGIAAASPALIGLGLDSVVMLMSTFALVWELGGRWDERQERAALRALSVAFFAIAAYLVLQSVRELVARIEPELPLAGLIAAVLGALVLPPLTMAKRSLARRLGSATLHSDADKTRLYALLCVAALIGLALHRAFGWWWADPVSGLVVAALAVREGMQDRAEARTRAVE